VIFLLLRNQFLLKDQANRAYHLPLSAGIIARQTQAELSAEKHDWH